MIVIFLIPLVVFGWLGHVIGKQKNQAGLGLWLGLLLGPIGLVITALLPDNHPRRKRRYATIRNRTQTATDDFLTNMR